MLPQYTTLKSLALTVFSIIVYVSCSNNSVNSSSKKTTAENDSIKYTREVVPDTSGCGWFFNDRHIRDTLINELAIIKESFDTISNIFSATFLATKKYRSLLACSIPAFLIKPNDTILISGYVYWTYSFEQPSGYPTLITKIVY